MTAKQTTQTVSGTSSQSNMDLSGHGSDSGLEIYRYDAFNRLSSHNNGAMAASYAYNANNLRSSKTVNNTKTDFVWNGQNLAAESRDSGVNTYTYDMTGIHITSQNGTVMSYIKDSHGSVIRTADASGNAMQEAEDRADYDAFGNVYTGSRNTPFGYSGEYVDSESGNIYLRNRYYNSATGRFITEDPAKDGLNWYVYCENEPIMHWDPSGYISAGYDDYGVWRDWDAEEFGTDSITYDSLTTLTQMWKYRVDDRSVIGNLANEVRRIARMDGYAERLKFITLFADGSSANATDIVISAGNILATVSAYIAQDKATKKAKEYYPDDRDGTEHNAFKHAYWNALMARTLGNDYAKLVADAHEFGAVENLDQSQYQQALMNMDLWNNHVGRDIWANSNIDIMDYDVIEKIAEEVKNNMQYLSVVQ